MLNMDDASLLQIQESDFKIDKRLDGTEDFHCLLPPCVGLFSYRTLRALNNHRANTHNLPEIPKRKRGPKRTESSSSRSRSRSTDAIKRQIIKRSTDIDKRERGCRSMARLRALRLAMAQSGKAEEKDHVSEIIKEVDKALESWEQGRAKRRMLLERRVQMARVQWATKGELVSMPVNLEDCDASEINLVIEDEDNLRLEHNMIDYNDEHCLKMEDDRIHEVCSASMPHNKVHDCEGLEDVSEIRPKVVKFQNQEDASNALLFAANPTN